MTSTTPPPQAVRHHDVTASVLVACDIDGTLLHTGTTVPLVTADAITAVRMAGHYVVLATGRSLVGALPVARSLGLDSTWIIASNGAVIARLSSTEPGGYSLHEQRTFDVDPVVQLARARIPGVRIAVEEVGWGWRVSEEFASGRLNGQQRVVGGFDELWATPVTRLVLAGLGVETLLQALRELGVTATPDGAGWVDVTPRGLSKASALETIRARLDVPADQTVAIGDGLNDAEMLAWAAHSIAMGHAPEEIKALATHVTGTIHEHGAAAALHSLIDGATLLQSPTLAWSTQYGAHRTMTSNIHSAPADTETDAVADAASIIRTEIYLGPDGLAVQPVIPPHATQRYLRALDLHPGMRVLEVGTGSGYSAALMGHIVGTSGHVLTIDSDEALSRRAGDLFAAHGHHAIAALGNGLLGHAGRAPYDRIFVGATPAAIPATWLDQLAEGGVLVTGCLVSDLPGSYAVAHIAKTTDGPRVTVHAGRYPPMGVRSACPTVTVVRSQNNAHYYLATSYPERGTAERFLGLLRTGHAEPWPTAPGEFLDLKNWLLARRPAGLFTARTEHGEGIGLAMQFDGTSEAAMVTASGFVARPVGGPMAARLTDLMVDWRNEGYTRTDELDAMLLRSGDTYRVRLDD